MYVPGPSRAPTLDSISEEDTLNPSKDVPNTTEATVPSIGKLADEDGTLGSSEDNVVFFPSKKMLSTKTTDTTADNGTFTTATVGSVLVPKSQGNLPTFDEDDADDLRQYVSDQAPTDAETGTQPKTTVSSHSKTMNVWGNMFFTIVPLILIAWGLMFLWSWISSKRLRQQRVPIPRTYLGVNTVSQQLPISSSVIN